MGDDGHIYIGKTQDEDVVEQKPAPQVKRKESLWEVTDDDFVKESTKKIPKGPSKKVLTQALSSVREKITVTAKDAFDEGKHQYAESYTDFRFRLKDTKTVAKNLMKGLAATLAQPVWIVKKDKAPKQYSRGTLFVMDTIRFGGTFAGIFAALFITLNYQSFSQIILPYLDPVERISSANGSVDQIDNALKEKLLRSPMLATAGRQEGDLLSFLPDVGPPENRVIIPKLNINIPLVTPSYASLLKEDWEGVEEDIQRALKHGVVHYPGTARPGQAGNFFVTGHSSYYPWADGDYKTVFARLHELAIGDEYWVYYGGDKYRYIITGKKEVKPTNVDVLDQPTNKRTATLMTCTPVGTTLRRLILTAQEIDPLTGVALKVGEHESRPVQKITPSALPI